MNTDKPVRVEYIPRPPKDYTVGEKTESVSSMSQNNIRTLGPRLDSGEIDHVVILGPNACTGWRVFTTRKVNFVWPSFPSHASPELEKEYAQATRRVVHVVIT